MVGAILVYAFVSLVVGGVAATYEIWHRPVMLDRADGSGRFPSPKADAGEIVSFGLFVTFCWPLLAVGWILTRPSA